MSLFSSKRQNVSKYFAASRSPRSRNGKSGIKNNPERRRRAYFHLMERQERRGDAAVASLRVVVIPWRVRKVDSTEPGVAPTRCALVQSALLLLVCLGLPERQKEFASLS